MVGKAIQKIGPKDLAISFTGDFAAFASVSLGLLFWETE